MDILIKNGLIVNRGKAEYGDLLISGQRIKKVGGTIQTTGAVKEIDATGKIIMPGIIDDQVHFREPGLTHKAEIYTEAKAAVVGGTTSFMEMPNTKPPATTQEKLAEKYARAAQCSLGNYSFFMGAANDNLEEVLKTDGATVCGIKAFMGSSTGNMLVDNPVTLERLFSECPLLIATHCEDEETVRKNMELFEQHYGQTVPMDQHPNIRTVEACWLSSSLASKLAKKHNARLHILHISTAKELALFDNKLPLREKRITSEVCVHHLYFNSDDYEQYGSEIKCNPAIKSKTNQEALLPALLDNRIDIIATDHAPHTVAEKQGNYFDAPSGVPLVQHSMNIMLEFYHQGKITLEQIVDKMSHAPAECFRMIDRGYLDEGAFADVIIVDPNKELTVTKENLQYKCGWSPFEGHVFKGNVDTTIVSGHLAWHDQQFNENQYGQRLLFEADR